MGFNSKKTSQPSKPHLKLKLKMLSFTVFTVLASTAMLVEAAPGRGYYYRQSSHRNKIMAKAPVWQSGVWRPVEKAVDTRTAQVGDVVDVAVGAGAFTTLVKIVSGLGLVDPLKGVEAVTIFAPSDDAFAKLPAGTLESLTTEQATAIVSRHVVAGATVLAADVATGPVGTFGGETIDLIKTEQGGVQVSYNGNAVNVVTADVKASNGVIHVIDNVIL